MSKLEKNYLFSTFLLTFAITLPHAVLTILLLQEKDITLIDLATMQMFFSFAIFISEIPSGYFADKLGREKLYVISLILQLISFILLLVDGLLILYLSWFIYGLATAMRSGTIEAEIINQYKKSNNQSLIDSFTKRELQIEISAAIIAATLGSFLYIKFGIYIYVLSIILVILNIIYSLYIFNFKTSDEQLSAKKLQLKDFSFIIEHKMILLSIISLASLQLISQTVFQYWQVLYDHEGISVKLFGIVYTIINIFMLISSKKKVIDFFKYINSIYISILILLVYCISIIASPIIFFIIFPFIMILYNVLFIRYKTIFRENIPTENTSVSISIQGSFSRVISVIWLFIVSSLFVEKQVVYLFFFGFIIFIIITCILYYFRRYLYRK